MNTSSEGSDVVGQQQPKENEGENSNMLEQQQKQQNQQQLQEGEYDEVVVDDDVDDEHENDDDDNSNNNNNLYYALVIDSGPIIKLTGLSSLRNTAQTYYTTPSVIREIRDTKAREHLSQLPFEITPREPTPESIKKVIDFARLTGDYQSLSSVDIQVLALLYDLEMEGCVRSNKSIDHIRTKPKRMVGVGRIESLASNKDKEEEKKEDIISASVDQQQQQEKKLDGVTFFQKGPANEQQQSETRRVADSDDNDKGPKTWAMLVNPSVASASNSAAVAQQRPLENSAAETKDNKKSLNVTFNSMKLDVASNDIRKTSASPTASRLKVVGGYDDDDDAVDGQFSDAEEEENEVETSHDDDDDDDKDDGYAYDSDKDISDEECDVYILDPEEVEERKRNRQQQDDSDGESFKHHQQQQQHQEEVAVVSNDFPSLAETLQVPYGSDDDDDNGGNDDQANNDVSDEQNNDNNKKNAAILAKEEADKRKEQALKPVSKSGKSYNSFRNYKNVVTAKGVVINKKTAKEDASITNTEDGGVSFAGLGVGGDNNDEDEEKPKADAQQQQQSRILGGMTMSGQGTEVDDDGEGWITCTKDIRKMKATGTLDPSTTSKNHNKDSKQDKQIQSKKNQGPPMKYRAACATTDFAMQNVILQMNFELLSVDGMKVRKLKSWVTRCGACYTVYADGDDSAAASGTSIKGMNKRLFCSKCGSDMMQRISASVDGKTGRLRLHLSKKYKHNLRGTKYSLPKPGTHNRFQGDLLLREDQLLMGAWNQKLKKRSGGKAAYEAQQSMFGSDLATTVGCFADSRDDIRVGFGKRNPNASKHGRERRGKKKKGPDKACGLRRY